jgi:Family of unknown function (DUF6210)
VAETPLTFTLPMDGDEPEDLMQVVVMADSDLIYRQQYGGYACRHAEAEGFLVPAWAHPEARKALDDLFLVELGKGGVPENRRNEVVERVGVALQRVWYRGTGDRAAVLRIDLSRADELDEAWIPVLTPDGPGYLAWINSD